MNDVKIIKLKTTEDIICFYEEIGEKVKISNPFSVYIEYNRKTRSQNLIMNFWLPVNLIKSQSAILNSSEILTVMEPKEEFVEYFLNMVNGLNDETKEETEELIKLFLEKLDAKSLNKIH